MGGEPVSYSDGDVDDIVSDAVRREREACAQIADEHSGGVGGMSATIVAQLIRARAEAERSFGQQST